jgi:hypothetical protein
MVTLHAGEVGLEVGLWIDDRRVSNREDVEEREVGIGDDVGPKEEALAVEDGIKPLLLSGSSVSSGSGG